MFFVFTVVFVEFQLVQDILCDFSIATLAAVDDPSAIHILLHRARGALISIIVR